MRPSGVPQMMTLEYWKLHDLSITIESPTVTHSDLCANISDSLIRSKMYMSMALYRKNGTSNCKGWHNCFVTRTIQVAFSVLRIVMRMRLRTSCGIMASYVPLSMTTNTEILERLQSKALEMTVDAPWYVLNTVI
jgi:hypothetical protein